MRGGELNPRPFPVISAGVTDRVWGGDLLHANCRRILAAHVDGACGCGMAGTLQLPCRSLRPGLSLIAGECPLSSHPTPGPAR